MIKDQCEYLRLNMARNDFDFIATNKPCNKTASSVVGRGFHYEPVIKAQENYDAPLPKRSKRLSKQLSKCPEFLDFTGFKHGTFTVLHLAQKGNSGGARWVCRCQCGQYEIRTTKAIKNHMKPNNNYDIDTCGHCADLKKLRNMASAKSMRYSYKDYMDKISLRKASV